MVCPQIVDYLGAAQLRLSLLWPYWQLCLFLDCRSLQNQLCTPRYTCAPTKESSKETDLSWATAQNCAGSRGGSETRGRTLATSPGPEQSSAVSGPWSGLALKHTDPGGPCWHQAQHISRQQPRNISKTWKWEIVDGLDQESLNGYSSKCWGRAAECMWEYSGEDGNLWNNFIVNG